MNKQQQNNWTKITKVIVSRVAHLASMSR